LQKIYSYCLSGTDIIGSSRAGASECPGPVHMTQSTPDSVIDRVKTLVEEQRSK